MYQIARILCTSLLLLSHCVCASQEAINAVLPAHMPPYVISQPSSGIAVEIIKSAYAKNDQKVKFSFLSNNRMHKEFFKKNHTLAFSIPFQQYPTPLYFSKPLLSFKNTAITLTKRNITINSIHHLMPLRITAFQNAINILGEEFKRVVETNPNYDEITDQISQITLLLKGRTDVILMEERIFWHYFNALNLNDSLRNNFRFHAIFKESNRYCAFHDKRQRDEFNRALTSLQRRSEYQKIFAKYINP